MLYYIGELDAGIRTTQPLPFVTLLSIQPTTTATTTTSDRTNDRPNKPNARPPDLLHNHPSFNRPLHSTTSHNETARTWVICTCLTNLNRPTQCPCGSLFDTTVDGHDSFCYPLGSISQTSTTTLSLSLSHFPTQPPGSISQKNTTLNRENMTGYTIYLSVLLVVGRRTSRRMR